MSKGKTVRPGVREMSTTEVVGSVPNVGGPVTSNIEQNVFRYQYLSVHFSSET